MSLFRIPSPIVELKSSFISDNQLQVFVKRDDLIHPEVSGNKWRKLKYNIEATKEKGHDTILTFGGAYSNHLLATAVAGKLYGLKTIAIVRGEKPAQLSHTLKDCEQNGMHIQYISRSSYKDKTDASFLESLTQEFGSFFLIPEGGANELGLKGCSELMQEVNQSFDYIACSAGTGSTAAGILESLNDEKLLVVPALKGIDFRNEAVFESFKGSAKEKQVEFLTNYHFGGYAKVKEELIQFVREFYLEYNLQLDLVYTGKLFYGIFDLIQKQHLPAGTKILLIHTGGLQGNRGMEKRLGYPLFKVNS